MTLIYDQELSRVGIWKLGGSSQFSLPGSKVPLHLSHADRPANLGIRFGSFDSEAYIYIYILYTYTIDISSIRFNVHVQQIYKKYIYTRITG